MYAELIVERGSNQGKRFVIRPGQRFEIGRSGVSVCLEQDNAVSRKHARIWLRADGSLFLADLNSRNGTFVGSQSLRLRPHLPTEIFSESRIQIGAQTLVITIENEDDDTRRVQILEREQNEPILTADLELLATLGRGPHGDVYAAYQRLMDRRVAVKVLHSSGGSSVKRFRQEGRLACRLRSQYVVEVYDFRVVGNRVFLIMELVDGVSLRDRLTTPLDVPTALKIGEEVALGLAAVHHVGIIHRNIKPSNVLLASGGCAMLSDFGIAKDVWSEGRLTPPKTAFGSLAYIAPEQAADAAMVDERADIYSLGALLYRMLAGGAPFEGIGMEALLKGSRGDPAPVHSLNNMCSEDISALVGAMLSQDRDGRPATAVDVAGRLKELRALHHTEPTSYSAGSTARITQTDQLPAIGPATEREPESAEPKTARWGQSQPGDTPSAPEN